MRAATQATLNTEYDKQQREAAEQAKALTADVIGAARKGTLHDLPPDMLAQLPNETVSALSDISRRVAGGETLRSDSMVEGTLSRLTPEQLADADLTAPDTLRGLSPARHAEWTRRQQAIRDGDGQARADQRALTDLSDLMDALDIATNRQTEIVSRLADQVVLQEIETGKPETKAVMTAFSKALVLTANSAKITAKRAIASHAGSQLDNKTNARITNTGSREAEREPTNGEQKQGKSVDGKDYKTESVPLWTGYGLFRPEGHKYVVGRDGSFIPSGEQEPGIGSFIDDYIPGGHRFGTNHDALVDTLTEDYGIPDWLANFPTMGLVFAYSLFQEFFNKETEILNEIFGTDHEIPYKHTHPVEDGK